MQHHIQRDAYQGHIYRLDEGYMTLYALAGQIFIDKIRSKIRSAYISPVKVPEIE